MKKTLIQGVMLLSLFLGTWFVFYQIDWMTFLHIRDITNQSEEKLVELSKKAYACKLKSLCSYLPN